MIGRFYWEQVSFTFYYVIHQSNGNCVYRGTYGEKGIYVTDLNVRGKHQSPNDRTGNGANLGFRRCPAGSTRAI